MIQHFATRTLVFSHTCFYELQKCNRIISVKDKCVLRCFRFCHSRNVKGVKI